MPTKTSLLEEWDIGVPTTEDERELAEQRFFLPNDPHIYDEWDNDDKQERFARASRYGMHCVTKSLAGQLVAGAHKPSVFDLYKIAARVRYQTNLVLYPEADNFGTPAFTAVIAHIMEEQLGPYTPRWAKSFQKIRKHFEQLWNYAEQKPEILSSLKELNDHDAEKTLALLDLRHGLKICHNKIVTNGMDNGFTVNEKGNHFDPGKNYRTIYFWGEAYENGKYVRYPFGSMRLSPEENRIHLYRMPIESRKYAFDEADYCLESMITAYQAEKPDWDLFWECYAGLARSLYDANPCARGGQTATLMVLGGILKAFGLEVCKQGNAKPLYDYTFDANLAIEGLYTLNGFFIDHFGDDLHHLNLNPVSSPEEMAKLEIDPDFFNKDDMKIDWDGFHQIKTPQERLKDNLSIWYAPPDENFKIVRCGLDAAGKPNVKLLPPEYQERADYFQDWIGDELFTKIYDLSPQKARGRG